MLNKHKLILKVSNITKKSGLNFSKNHQNILFYFLLLKYILKQNIVLLKIKKTKGTQIKKYRVIKSPFVNNKNYNKLIEMNYKNKINFFFSIKNCNFIKYTKIQNQLLIFSQISNITNNLNNKIKISYFLKKISMKKN